VKIRQSLLGSADSCLRKAQYSLESDVYYGGSVRAVGTAYHAGLEYYYLNRMKGPEYDFDCAEQAIEECEVFAESALSAEIEKSGEGATFTWDPAFPDFEAARKAAVDMLKHYFMDGNAWPEDWEVLGVEVPFELDIPGGHTASSNGIDLVLRDPAGCIRGVDHKTANKMWPASKADARKNNQGALYWGALRQLYPDAPGWFFTFDVMTYAGKFQRFNCDPTEAHFDAVVNKAVQLATLVEGMRKAAMDLPANPASNLCSAQYCDFWDVCPHGAALDRGSLFLS
jgi:hypothetical protein